MNGTFLLPPNIEASYQYTDGVVCACCHKSINAFSLFGPTVDPSSGLMRRMYLGHCVRCGQSFEVEQFEADGAWLIYRYRIEGGQWYQLQSLPEPPLVTTGPGGEFTKTLSAPELDLKTKQLLESFVEIQRSLCGVLHGLMDSVKHDTNNH
ncbi:MAG: hypothetical protein DRP56_04130 [Planctomycetota bacterium]|nr:MAG: hypothetical protein DRP56_04130 [Planctomycetota bacterium]